MKVEELERALSYHGFSHGERTVCVAFRHNGETVLSQIESVSDNGGSLQLNETEFAKSELYSGTRSDEPPSDAKPLSLSAFQRELMIEGAYRVMEDRRKRLEIQRGRPFAIISKDIQHGIENAERDLVVAGYLIESLVDS